MKKGNNTMSTSKKTFKSVGFVGISTLLFSSQSLATSEGGGTGKRGFLELISDIGSLGKAFGEASLIWIIALGLVIVAGGLITIMLASNTQNQQKTKSAGAIAMIVGFCLTGITSFIEMGNTSVTQESSEYSEFFSGNNNE